MRSDVVPEERRRRRRWSSRGVARCRRRFSLAARYAAVNGTTSRQERPAQEGGTASGAAEAGLGRVPVLTLVRHLALINADRFAAAVAIFGEGGVEAAQTVRPALSHHVSLAAELRADRRGASCVNLWDVRKRRRIAVAVPAEMVHLDERESRYKSNERAPTLTRDI